MGYSEFYWKGLERGEGRLARLSREERSEFSKKGAAASNKMQSIRREVEAILKDKQMLLDKSIADVLEENPLAVTKILSKMAKDAEGGDLKAAAIFLEYSGIKAPKQTETKIETETMSPDEARTYLNNYPKGVYQMKKMTKDMKMSARDMMKMKQMKMMMKDPLMKDSSDMLENKKMKMMKKGK